MPQFCDIHKLPCEYLVKAKLQFVCAKCLIEHQEKYGRTVYYAKQKFIQQIAKLAEKESAKLKSVDMINVREQTSKVFDEFYQRFIRTIRKSLQSVVEVYNMLLQETTTTFHEMISAFESKAAQYSLSFERENKLFRRICDNSESSILNQTTEVVERMLTAVESGKFFSQQYFKSYQVTHQELSKERNRLSDQLTSTQQFFRKMTTQYVGFHMQFESRLKNSKFLGVYLEEGDTFTNGTKLFRNIKNAWYNICSRKELPFEKQTRIQIIEIGEAAWGLAIGLTPECATENKSPGSGPSLPSFQGFVFANLKRAGSEKHISISQHFRVGDIIGIKEEKRIAYFSKNGKRMPKAIPLQNNKKYYINFALRMGEIKLL